MKEFIAAMIMAVAASIFSVSFGYSAGYQDGQVDAINGTIKYELVQQKDGTTIWKEKK